ncbi:hypothetical protein ASF29_20565 [Rhizobium sp. Leaf262]|nr:hypothetical protein ASF29_20565 [Rhizobium sp. Leaf262]
MDTERRSCHGQVLPRERRSLGKRWPGFLTGLDLEGEAGCFEAPAGHLSMRAAGVAGLALERAEEETGHNRATLILRRAGAAGASKGEGCGLGAEHAADASRLCPSAKAPQHEGGGCGRRLQRLT